MNQKIRQQEKSSTQEKERDFFIFRATDDPDFERNFCEKREFLRTRIRNTNPLSRFSSQTPDKFKRARFILSEPVLGTLFFKTSFRQREREDLFKKAFRERERERLKTYTFIYIHKERERKREKFWADRAASSQSRTSFWSEIND